LDVAFHAERNTGRHRGCQRARRLGQGRLPVLSAITWTAASPISRWNCWDGCGDRVLCFPARRCSRCRRWPGC